MNVSIMTLGPVGTGERLTIKDIFPEVCMLKAAVLYGDDIQILSGAFPIWETLQRFHHPESMSLTDKLNYSIRLFGVARSLDGVPDGARTLLEKLQAELHQFRSAPEQASVPADQMEELINWIWPQINLAAQHLVLPELPAILKLIDQKRLTVGDVFTAHPPPPDLTIKYGPNVDRSLLTPDLERELHKALGQLSAVGLAADAVISNPLTFPMLDDHVGSMVELKRDAAQSNRNIRRTTAELAKGLFARLPTFEGASLDEIVQIRSELDPHVRQFQVTLGSMAAKMKDVAAEDFPTAVEETWFAEVLPEIHELNEAIRRNRYLSTELLQGAVTKPEGIAAIAGGLVLGATQSGLASLISPAIMAAVPALARAVERRKLANQLEQHRFFFLYKLSKPIRKSGLRKSKKR